MIPKSSFAITSVMCVVACSGDLGVGEVVPEPAQASFAHDLRTSEGEGGAVKQIVPWPKGTIKYAFDNEPSTLDPDLFRAEVRAGLREWERVTGDRVSFREQASPLDAHVVIGFRLGDHIGDQSCDDQFTNPSGTIAHVFTYDQECLAGVIHLNQDLTWVMNGVNEKGTYDVRYAILHEVGHLLGLGHHPDPGHIMYPEYIGVVRKLTDEEGQDAVAALEGS